MYQIFYDKSLVYNPHFVDRKYSILCGNLHLIVGAAGHLAFEVSDAHPLCGLFQPMKGVIDVKDDNEIIFRGRIIRTTRNIYNEQRIECEGQLAVLNDSYMKPFTFSRTPPTGNVVRDFLEMLLTNHNAQVGLDQQIHLGDVTVTAPDNHLYRYSKQYLSTWETMNSRLQGSELGGFFCLRYTEEKTYLDYLSDFPTTNIQKVEWAKNLLDFNNSCFGGDLYTAILPVGKDGVTITSLPDGSLGGNKHKTGAIIFDAEREKIYGRISKIKTWDSISDPKHLRDNALKQLAQKGLTMPETIRCKACDLSVIDGVPSFRAGKNVMVYSAPHEISETYPLMESSINLLNPGDTEITLTKCARTMTGTFEQRKQELTNIAQTAAGQVEKELQTQMDTVKETVETARKESQTHVEQTSESIRTEITDVIAKINGVSKDLNLTQSQIEQLSSELTLKFTQSNNHIESVNGQLQDQYDEIRKVIRATIDGIVLGESNSDTQLHLDNDTIEILVTGVAEMYINHSGLFATQVTVDTIHIGDYTWTAENSHLTLS